MTLHVFVSKNGGTWCAERDASGRCGYTAEDTTHHYIERADLYRAAIAPRPLPTAFATSMRHWLFVDATLVEIPGRDNVRTDVFTTALRAAIGTAEEWKDITEASYRLDKEIDLTGLGRYIAGQNSQSIYCANRLLRTIAQELYAEHVSEEERYG